MKIRRVTPKQFKVIAERKASTEGVMVAKSVKTEIEPEGEPDDRVLRFTISTDDVDRDSDTIAVDGWELENFQKAGTVLWAHEPWTPPIASPKKTEIADGKLISLAQFLPTDLSDHDHVKFSDMIYQMYKLGIMKAVSVGFLPKEFQENGERQGFFPIDFTRQELLEYSAVPVPSNPNALHEASAKGMDLQPLKEWAGSALEKSDNSGLWIPKQDLESLVKELSESIEITSSETTAIKSDELIEFVDIDGVDGQHVDTKDVAEEGDPISPADETGAESDESTDDEDKAESKGAISWDAAHPDGTPKADEDQEWDGPAAVADAEIEDMMHISTWVDSENADVKGGYKLPHHWPDGEYTLNWAGTAAAMGALLGARGGVDIPEEDRRGVYEHLARHYREFDKEPPEFEAAAPESEEAEQEDDKTAPIAEPKDTSPETPTVEDEADDGVDKQVYDLCKLVEDLYAGMGESLSSVNEILLRHSRRRIGQILSRASKRTEEEPAEDTTEETTEEILELVDDDKGIEITDTRSGDDLIELDMDQEEINNVFHEAVSHAVMRTTGRLP